ncbi:SLATT domain-containing protein [Lysinibacillus sp. OTC-L20]|uniref:SLATT domain-containing protein n=1 Tax=Lysinibacillus sp. OTC-L20 TaxID=3342791 RepID=UPI0035B84DAC
MDKDIFLKSIAEHGYNVYFGAKKHFAIYDIVEKVPGWIAFNTLCIGIWKIYAPIFTFNKGVSLLIVFVSIALLISQYATKKDEYRDNGNKLIEIHNELKSLYYQVQTSSTSTVNQTHQDKLQEI